MKKFFGADFPAAGQALVVVLVVLLLVTVAAAATLYLVGTSSKTTQSYITNTNTLYAADAGVSDAEWQIANATADVPATNASDITYQLPSINGYIPSVTIHLQDSQTYRVISIAGITTITAYVSYQPPTGTGLFSDAIVATGAAGINFTNKGNASINGNTFVNGQISFTGGSNTFNGDVYAANGITGSGGVITGTQEITNGSDSIGTPTVVAQQVFTTPDAQMAALRQTIINNNTVAGGPPWSNTSNPWSPATGYYNGQTVEYGVTLSGATITFNGGTPLYIGGDLNLAGGTNNITFNCPVEVAGSIISSSGNGTLTFNNTLYVGGNVTIGSAYNIVLSQAAYIQGSLTLTNGAFIAEANTAPAGNNKCIVVDGNITMNGGTALGNVNQLPLIIDLSSGSTVTLGAGGEIDAAIYAPSAAVSLTGAAVIYGALIAGSVSTNKGSPRVTNDPALASRSDLTSFTGGVAGTPAVVKLLNYTTVQ